MPAAIRINALASLCLAFGPVSAAPWSAFSPVDVSRVHGEGIFHHLGSGGRNGLAVSPTKVALVWEDNRDGEVRCYLGRRDNQVAVFSDVLFSGDEACYEPTVTGLSNGQFAVAWEERGAVWIRIATETDLGSPLKLSTGTAAQIVVAGTHEGGLAAAWSQREGEHTRILVAQLERDGPLGLRIMHRQPVEKTRTTSDQAYPDIIALNGGRLLLAWEDRRKGHTAILAASGRLPFSFATPQQINESFWGGRALGYGRGTGAMRVSLASADGEQIVAVWADKRDFLSGYDIYAAAQTAGAVNFGANEKVQDEFADLVAQWHPDVTAGRLGHRPLAVAVWDDDREGGPDIWMSWRIDGEWSDDWEVPGASGDGVQVEPAVALDASGRLHLAWVEKESIDGPSSIRYLSAHPKSTDAPDVAK